MWICEIPSFAKKRARACRSGLRLCAAFLLFLLASLSAATPAQEIELPPDGEISEMVFTIETGSDDLRQDSKVFVGVRGEDGRESEFQFSQRGERFADRTQLTRRFVLPRSIAHSRIARIYVRFVQGTTWASNPDEWEMRTVSVRGIRTDRSFVELVSGLARPHKFQRSSRFNLPALPFRRVVEPGTGPAARQRMNATVFTGEDDLRSKSMMHVFLVFTDGREATAWTFGMPSNTERSKRVDVPAGSTGVLNRVEVVMEGGNLPSSITDQTDQWDLKGVRIESADRDTEPLYTNLRINRRLAGADAWQSPVLERRPYPSHSSTWLEVQAITGEDDLKASSRVVVGVELRDGSQQTSTRIMGLGRGLRAWQMGKASMDLRGPEAGRSLRVENIRRVFVRFVSGSNDEWSLKGVIVRYRGGNDLYRLFEDYSINRKLRPGETWTSAEMPGFDVPVR